MGAVVVGDGVEDGMFGWTEGGLPISFMEVMEGHQLGLSAAEDR
jgi:hypothetical protein